MEGHAEDGHDAAASGAPGGSVDDTAAAAAKNSAAAGGGGGQQATFMDKRALQMSLMSLIEDEGFIDMLHTRYMTVMKRRGSR